MMHQLSSPVLLCKCGGGRRREKKRGRRKERGREMGRRWEGDFYLRGAWASSKW